MNEYLLIILIFIVAFFYSSIGHGGATGYLAIMALFAVTPEHMRSSALVLNLMVSLIAFVNYSRKGFFHSEIFFSLALGSVPLAYIGGSVLLDAGLYKMVLGCFLIFASVFIFVRPVIQDGQKKQLPVYFGIIIGGLLGFISGLIGIGGGIILSPLLVIFKWTTIKEAAAISALFIFVNSAAALAGSINKGLSFHPMIYFWLGAAFLAGLAGSYIGSAKLPTQKLKYIMGVVLGSVGIKLLIKM